MLDHDKQMLAVDSLSHAAHMTQHAAQQFMSDVAAAMVLPSVLYRPKLSIDGNQWCALYGQNLHEGVAGFGDSPEAAMDDFNANWVRPIKASESAKNALDEMMGAQSFPSIKAKATP